MRYALPISTIRRLFISRCLATALLVLAVSPFTAPFSTFDGADILTLSPMHAGDVKVKDVDHAIDPIDLRSDTFAVLGVGVAVKSGDSRLTEPPPSHSPVLRI